MKLKLWIVLIGIGILLGGCSRRSTVSRYGEPLLYDRTTRVYVIEQQPGVYYRSGVYYRRSGKAWEASSRAGGPWRHVPAHRLPPGLRKKV
jgi:hypothetical protein